MNTHDILTGAKLLFKAAKEANNGDVVRESVMCERIKTCTECPKLTKVGFNFTSRASSALASALNRHRVSPQIREMACGVCKCSLGMLAPSRTYHKDNEDEAAKRPETCWMVTEQAENDAL